MLKKHFLVKKIYIVLILFTFSGMISSCDTSDSTRFFQLSTNVNPPEGGTISPSGGEFDNGSLVEIEAQPSEGYLFVRWEGDLSGTENPVSFEINDDMDVTAMFEKRDYPLSIEIEGEGTVTEEVVAEKTTDYPFGTNVQLTANPSEGWKFSQWQGDLQGEENPATILIDQTKTVTAVFESDVSVEIDILAPTDSERFLTADEIQFGLEVIGDDVSEENILWSSDIDGELGSGTSLEVDGLSAGEHTITVSIFGNTEKIIVRVFADLWDLYRSEPAQEEIDRIMGDFNIEYIDGSEPDQKWADYGFDFNPGMGEPSKLVIIARLDVLRRQQFDEHPTFIGGHETVYDWLRSVVHTIRVDLGRCGGGTGGGGFITTNAGFAHWEPFFSNTCNESEDIDFAVYEGPLSFLVHEARHSEPGDPGHTVCENGIAGDEMLENGSGYAWAAKYHMWVYKHSLFDPPFVRENDPQGTHARASATLLLEDRICSEPTHSDPRVQAIIDELLGS